MHVDAAEERACLNGCAGDDAEGHLEDGAAARDWEAVLRTTLENHLREISVLERELEEYKDMLLLVLCHTDPHPNTCRRTLLEIKHFVLQKRLGIGLEVR